MQLLEISLFFGAAAARIVGMAEFSFVHRMVYVCVLAVYLLYTSINTKLFHRATKLMMQFPLMRLYTNTRHMYSNMYSLAFCNCIQRSHLLDYHSFACAFCIVPLASDSPVCHQYLLFCYISLLCDETIAPIENQPRNKLENHSKMSGNVNSNLLTAMNRMRSCIRVFSRWRINDARKPEAY